MYIYIFNRDHANQAISLRTHKCSCRSIFFAEMDSLGRTRPQHNTVERPIMDTLKSGQPPYNGHTVCPLPIYCPTSEEGEQWTKHSSPIRPLFGGSTVAS